MLVMCLLLAMSWSRLLGMSQKVLTANELHEEEIMRLPVELVEVVPKFMKKVFSLITRTMM